MSGEQAHKYTQTAFVVEVQNIFNHILIIPFRLINNHAYCSEMSYSLVRKTTLPLCALNINTSFSLDNQPMPLT